MAEIIAHCYFWHLSKCSTWAPTHTTSRQTCSGCPVLTHWDSEIVPPTGADRWLGSGVCWGDGAGAGQQTHRCPTHLEIWASRGHEGGSMAEPGAQEALEAQANTCPCLPRTSSTESKREPGSAAISYTGQITQGPAQLTQSGERAQHRRTGRAIARYCQVPITLSAQVFREETCRAGSR